jgi:hypothetical protein
MRERRWKVSDLFVVIKFGGKSEKSCSFVLVKSCFDVDCSCLTASALSFELT